MVKNYVLAQGIREHIIWNGNVWIFRSLFFVYLWRKCCCLMELFAEVLWVLCTKWGCLWIHCKKLNC